MGLGGVSLIAGCSDQFGDINELSGPSTTASEPSTPQVSPSEIQSANSEEQTEYKLTADDGDDMDSFGQSVTIEGTTALIGAWKDEDPNGEEAGSVYVFERSGASWSQQTKLNASDGDERDRFGAAVTIDGDTALVGATWDDDPNGFESGSVYVFTRSGGEWTEQAKLVASDGAMEFNFGTSLAIENDTVLIGSPLHDRGEKAEFAGSVYPFVRSGSEWAQQPQLVASSLNVADFFGTSVALDGDIALIGAPSTTPKGADGTCRGNAGSVYIFHRSGTEWLEQTKITANDGDTCDRFGADVALDGKTALIGAPTDEDPNGGGAGSAYVFRRSGDSWLEQAKLYAPDGDEGDNFGHTVALEGDTALVGAWNNERVKERVGKDPLILGGVGSVYMFTRTAGEWSYHRTLWASDWNERKESVNFGWSLAFDNGTAITGTPRFSDEENSEDGMLTGGDGAVYILEL